MFLLGRKNRLYSFINRRIFKVSMIFKKEFKNLGSGYNKNENNKINNKRKKNNKLKKSKL